MDNTELVKEVEDPKTVEVAEDGDSKDVSMFIFQSPEIFTAKIAQLDDEKVVENKPLQEIDEAVTTKNHVLTLFCLSH